MASTWHVYVAPDSLWKTRLGDAPTVPLGDVMEGTGPVESTAHVKVAGESTTAPATARTLKVYGFRLSTRPAYDLGLEQLVNAASAGASSHSKASAVVAVNEKETDGPEIAAGVSVR